MNSRRWAFLATIPLAFVVLTLGAYSTAIAVALTGFVIAAVDAILAIQGKAPDD